MIVYKIDRQNQASASSQIKDMDAVLREIPESLAILQNLLTQHRQSISTPTIDNFGANLQQAVEGATKLTRIIAENSRRMCVVSDQASKHLLAIDEHFGSDLRTESESSPQVAAKV